MIDPIRRLLTEAGKAKQTRAFWQAATDVLSEWTGARVELTYKGLNESGALHAGAALPESGEPFLADFHDADGRHVSVRSEEHTSELQSQSNLVCRLLLEKKKKHKRTTH